MVDLDEKGRIKRVDKSDIVNSGHAVCNTCGKDMPVCADTVCFLCGRTSCYSHSYTHGDKWLCRRCSDFVKSVKEQ